ncbi:MAG: acyl-CoA dehydrogenase, partial [Novosphingobium sp.]
MNFDLSEDEAMLKTLGERVVQDRYCGDMRRAYLDQPCGFSPENWALLGELGLIAALGSRASDEAAFGPDAIVTLFEAFGRGLVVEPLIENVLLAARLFDTVAGQELSAEWRDALLAGSKRIALAHAEPRSRPGRLWLETRAEAVDGGMRVTGTKNCVPAGAGVDGFIVTARAAGTAGSTEGVALLFIAAETSGLTPTPWRMADGSAALRLDLDGAFVPQSCVLSGGITEIEQAQTMANLARGAEALGIMERLFADTLDYLRTREQFGTKIGSFQAIQHRMAAQYAVLEQTRGLLNLAVVSYGSRDFARNVAGLRAFMGAASINLGHEMIQFHGGMGVTD